jgi:HlyD family secretion protein
VLGAQATVDDAQSKLTRAVALSAKDLIPRSDLDAARIASDEAAADQRSAVAVVTQAEASVAQAKAAVDQAALNVEHTIIRAPIDGIVIDRDVDVGQTLRRRCSRRCCSGCRRPHRMQVR